MMDFYRRRFDATSNPIVGFFIGPAVMVLPNPESPIYPLGQEIRDGRDVVAEVGHGGAEPDRVWLLRVAVKKTGRIARPGGSAVREVGAMLVDRK